MIPAHLPVFELRIPMKKKGFLQKTALVSGVISEVISIICLIILVIKSQELGIEHIISASFLASTFFFFTCGLVLIFIGYADVPSLSFEEPEKNIE
ncbi:MAG: hypothetical protein V7739_06210 [Motiliproteus sp.]